MTFNDYLTHFKTTNLWAAMQNTVEASPWHREDNVAVHTEMCLAEHVKIAAASNDRQRLLVQVGLLFHDVGKPAAEETLEKKDGSGTYRRYAGHELLSANYFMQQYVTDPRLREVLAPIGGVEAARQVKWMIEHHLPFSYKDKTKRLHLREATFRAMGNDDVAFFDHLRSDCAGRISDDHPTKKQAVEDWIAEFKQLAPQPLSLRHFGTRLNAFMMIGPSGSGKSTWRRNQPAGLVLSLDDLRLEYVYGAAVPEVDLHGAYDRAWRLCTEQESVFNQFVQQVIKTRLQRAAKDHLPVYIDNTHSSVRSRAKWVEALRTHRYHITAVEFWNPLSVVLDRQLTRTDKRVPEKSVVQQWEASTCAWLGREVDAVQIVQGA